MLLIITYTILNPDQVNDIENKTAKKMYPISFILKLKSVPMTLVEPNILKNFEALRLTKSDVGVSPNTRRTVNLLSFYAYYYVDLIDDFTIVSW